MRLYLLRHGEADWPDWDGPDDERPLTRKGKQEMQQVARFLSRSGVAPAVVLSSPLVRAVQTAEIAAEELGLPVAQETALEPGFEMSKLYTLLTPYGDKDVLLVGHEPDFSGLVRDLTGGSVKMSKAGLARIDLDQPAMRGRLVWLVPPAVSTL